MSGHTPGPWEIVEERGIREIVGGESEDGSSVVLATVNEYWEWPENDANAYLMAAAPDLLAACEAVQEWLLFNEQLLDPQGLYNEQFIKSNNLVHAAIAKARGEA